MMRKLLSLLFLVSAGPALSQVNVLTANYNNERTSANLRETVLNTANVNVRQFGKLFSLPVDGFVYAQPLYVQGLDIPGKGAHNVVFVATMGNSVYAFDADSSAEALWQVNLWPTVPASAYGPYTDILPEIGILSTPVIDLESTTIYVVANTVEAGLHLFRMHALDLLTGREKFGGPVTIEATVAGTGAASQDGRLSFIAFDHIQRPGLLLLNGVVYAAFGSHGDQGNYHGWLIGYNARNLQERVAVFNVTPDGAAGAIWQSGRAPAVDGAGHIYVATGNGDFDGARNWSETFLKLSTAGGLAVADWFTPDNWMALNARDDELGACGPVLISGTNLLVGGDKSGVLYLLDRTNMGHLKAGNDQIVQTFRAVPFGIFNIALWNRADGPLLYLRGQGWFVRGFRMRDGRFETTPFSESRFAGSIPYDGIAVSADGSRTGTGILWLTTPDSLDHPAPGMLFAFDASDLSRELWNSTMNVARDHPGQFAKFATPTIANGKVYLPTFSNRLAVYGLLPQKREIAGIVNLGSLAGGPVSPGELVTIYGAGFGPSDPATLTLTSFGHVSTRLAGVRVLFDGVPAPLILVWSGQIRAVVPYSVAGRDVTEVRIEEDGRLSDAFSVPVAHAAPALFTMGIAGSGQGAILNEDASINSPQNPAARGSIVVLYGTGEGQTDPPGINGKPASDPLPKPLYRVSVTIDGQDAEILYAGAAPELVAGVIQVNARVPETVRRGDDIPVVLTVGGVNSQPGVVLALR